MATRKSKGPRRFNVWFSEEAANDLDVVSKALKLPKSEAVRTCVSLGAVAIREKLDGRRILIVSGEGRITASNNGSVTLPEGMQIVGEMRIPEPVEVGITPIVREE